MKSLLATLLVLVLIGGLPVTCAGQTPASGPAQQISSIPISAYVEVRFTNRTKVRGYLTQVGPDGFSFNTGNAAATGRLRQIAFSDVQSVKVVQRTHTPIPAWIVTGVIGAGVVLVFAVFLIERHNE